MRDLRALAESVRRIREEAGCAPLCEPLRAGDSSTDAERTAVLALGGERLWRVCATTHCSVCLGRVRKRVVSACCGGSFCAGCVEELTRRPRCRRCPLCRQQLVPHRCDDAVLAACRLKLSGQSKDT